MFEDLRRPEFTGERRCWPCTAVNAVIVGLVAVVAGILSPLVALLVLVLGGGAIWLRGYVVPYTPEFAPELVARLGFEDYFHDDVPDPDPSSLAPENVDGEALLADLVDAGVVVVDGESLGLDPDFADRWDAAMADLADLDTRVLTEATAEVAIAAEARVQRGDREWVVLGDGSGKVQSEHWLTRPVAIAETAAARLLADEFSGERRVAAAGALRMFLQDCPDCETTLEETTTMNCCGGHNGPGDAPSDVIHCPECDVGLYTFHDRTGL